MSINYYAIAAVWAVVALVCMAAVMLKPTTTPTRVPDDAETIGNGYMRAWAEGQSVYFVFRNMPSVRVRFDRKAVPELVRWMQSIDA